ncbi:MAG: nucleotide sugar dehydrogenase, partial [Thermoplasmata archaeon]|nr:nucleotide sugar dehydrogenase [Thermoplasmata archaeon]
VGIIGAGFVGQAIGAYFANRGQSVQYYDKNPKVVNTLRERGLFATMNIEDVVSRKYIFICVPTPTDEDGEQRLDSILSALREMSQKIRDKRDRNDHIVVIKSTILPGTTEKVLLPEIYKNVCPEEIGILYVPEFITEIHRTWINDNKYAITPNDEYRIVIGEGKNKKWGDMFLKELYESISIPVIRTNYKTAEMIKYASNNALAVRISYWNEVFLVCQELEIDSTIVARAASMDPRIGLYGTVHGKAFGGKCLPKDIKAFVHFANKYRKIPLLEGAIEINDYMRKKYGVRE